MLPVGANPLMVPRSEGREVDDKFCFPSSAHRNVAACERSEAIAALDERYRLDFPVFVP